ncbi:hypothetical protein ACHAWO_004009 [Cyclotella atomus]|jgi:hypothetical protein|uniref:Uncharacterized protein n=1 Tax=Cyclotella atomus TaxID=382360 RepID=A0ABD3NHN8_9STRA
MKLALAAALTGYHTAVVSASILPSSISNIFRSKHASSKNNNNNNNNKSVKFIVDEVGLSTIMDEPPSFQSSSSSSTSSPTVVTDIVSLGSITRMDYLTA